jgi:tetratricopeptide (TPR) repeat protein
MTCAQLGDVAKAEQHRRRFQELKAELQTAGRQVRADYRPLALTRRSFAETHTHVGWVYLSCKQADRAERVWLRAAEVDPTNTSARFQLVMLCQRAQRNEEALRFCEEMVRAEPRNGSHYLGLGNLNQRLKRTATAEQAFRRAVELAPERAESHFALAQFYVQGRTNATMAVALAEKAVTLAPLPPHYYMLSRAHALAGDWAAARAAIAEARKRDPQNAQYRQLEQALTAHPK